MRRGVGIGVVLLLVLAGIAIGVGAYNAGFSQGLEESGRAGDVVRVIGPGFGFFPFGLFLFPLFFIIAKSLVEAHGGQITARSQQGIGTTMRFTLPAREN
jgi:hypothetical protein